MFSKSNLGAIFGAIALIAAAGLSSPAGAANYGASNIAPSNTGGGSIGYNNDVSSDYRLKAHHAKHHTPSDQMR
jgi:hypothetical protein